MLIRKISKTSTPSSKVLTTLSTFAVAPDVNPLTFLPPMLKRLPVKGGESLRDFSCVHLPSDTLRISF